MNKYLSTGQSIVSVKVCAVRYVLPRGFKHNNFTYNLGTSIVSINGYHFIHPQQFIDSKYNSVYLCQARKIGVFLCQRRPEN